MKALLLLAHLWTAADGTAHDAHWIAEHFPECCGEEDCEVARAGQISYTAQGWKVEGYYGVVPPHEVKRSLDGKPWVCRYLYEPPSEGLRSLRCLFLPKARG